MNNLGLPALHTAACLESGAYLYEILKAGYSFSIEENSGEFIAKAEHDSEYTGYNTRGDSMVDAIRQLHRNIY